MTALDYADMDSVQRAAIRERLHRKAETHAEMRLAISEALTFFEAAEPQKVEK